MCAPVKDGCTPWARALIARFDRTLRKLKVRVAIVVAAPEHTNVSSSVPLEALTSTLQCATGTRQLARPSMQMVAQVRDHDDSSFRQYERPQQYTFTSSISALRQTSGSPDHWSL